MKTLPPLLLLLLTATSFADPSTGTDEVRTPARLPVVASLPPTPVVATHDGEPLAAEPPREDHARTIFGLPKNVGTGDRILRTFVGAALLGTGVWGLAGGELSSTTSGILMGVSAVPFATAATGYCPLYHALGVDHTF